MKITLQPGKYVVAVSGGVDSVSLLHALTRQPALELVVAHFDHGIRPDSAADQRFVAELARRYKLPYMYDTAALGAGASEATAREHRYRFLRQARRQTGAQAIVTAHHQDDLLETAILNLLRGTGPLGLTALAETDELRRPLLAVPKPEIIKYARRQGLEWREDSTNQDEHYRRNYVRRHFMPRLSAADRLSLLNLIGQTQKINSDINGLVAKLLDQNGNDGRLDRRWFNALPHDVSKEVLASWLRQHELADFDRPTIERLTVKAKVSPAGKLLEVRRRQRISVGRQHLALKGAER